MWFLFGILMVIAGVTGEPPSGALIVIGLLLVAFGDEI